MMRNLWLVVAVVATGVMSFIVVLQFLNTTSTPGPISKPLSTAAAPKESAANDALPSGFSAIPLLSDLGAKGWAAQSLEFKANAKGPGVVLTDASADYAVADYSPGVIPAGTFAVLIEVAKPSDTPSGVVLVRTQTGSGAQYNCALDPNQGAVQAWGKSDPVAKSDQLADRWRLTCTMRVEADAGPAVLRIFPAVGPDVKSQVGAQRGSVTLLRLATSSK